jgi:hypothetical protein
MVHNVVCPLFLFQPGRECCQAGRGLRVRLPGLLSEAAAIGDYTIFV